jgi:transcriptional regulator with XRE-family HTH domain
MADSPENLLSRIRARLKILGWTQTELASRAGYDVRTIRNVLYGRRVRYRTILDVCSALGIAPDGHTGPEPEVSEEHFGAYSQSSFAEYFGTYATVRRPYSHERLLMRSLFKVGWDQATGHMTFDEAQVYRGRDFSQHGSIYASPTTGLIHFLTIYHGAIRLITLTKLRDRSMHGVVLSQTDRNFGFQPCVSAILFRRLSNDIEIAAAREKIGPLLPDDPEFAANDLELKHVENEVIFFAKCVDPRDAESHPGSRDRRANRWRELPAKGQAPRQHHGKANSDATEEGEGEQAIAPARRTNGESGGRNSSKLPATRNPGSVQGADNTSGSRVAHSAIEPTNTVS